MAWAPQAMNHNVAMLEEKATWRRGSPATVVTPSQLAEVLAAAGLGSSVQRIELPVGDATVTFPPEEIGRVVEYLLRDGG